MRPASWFFIGQLIGNFDEEIILRTCSFIVILTLYVKLFILRPIDINNCLTIQIEEENYGEKCNNGGYCV
jgi:hypothetical protein